MFPLIGSDSVPVAENLNLSLIQDTVVLEPLTQLRRPNRWQQVQKLYRRVNHFLVLVCTYLRSEVFIDFFNG